MTFHSAISYAQREAPTRSLRSVEYDLLAQVTQRLRNAWVNRAADFPALVRAVTDWADPKPLVPLYLRRPDAKPSVAVRK